MRQTGHHRPRHPGEHRTGHATEPGTLGEPWTFGEPGTLGEPWTVGEPGTPGEPWTLGEPWTVGEPGTLGEPGTVGEPGTLGEPGTVGEPGTTGKSRTFRKLGTLRELGTLGPREIHWRLGDLPSELRHARRAQQLPGNPQIHPRLTERALDRRRRNPRVYRYRDGHRHGCDGNRNGHWRAWCGRRGSGQLQR
jgi:hypothetical protein